MRLLKKELWLACAVLLPGSGLAAEQTAAELQAQLDAAKAREEALERRISALEARLTGTAPAPAPTPTSRPENRDGFRSGDTTLKIGGFIKANAAFSRYSDGEVASGALLRDFHLPSGIPVGGESSEHFNAIAKQTRLWLATETPVAGQTLKGYIEFDFQTTQGAGSQRTTNGYTLALRRGYIAYGKWLFGQDWSNFQYVGALPESTDFVGTTEGTVFARQPQVRYTTPLGPRTTLSLALENPETASVTPASATLVENDDDRLPDATVQVIHGWNGGEISLAGLVRQLSVDTGTNKADATGWGLSASGKFVIHPDSGSDVRLMLTHGEGIGRYVGLNFAPDVIHSGNRLDTVEVTSAMAAVRFVWSPALRSTLMGSYIDASYPSASPLAANQSAWSLAGNLFYTPVKGLDVGIEYRHGVRELLSGADGAYDRVEVVARYGF